MKRKIGQQRVAGMGMMMVLPTILAAAMRSISGVDEEE
jgi:Na+-transporting methylmalonyl-CoA/oxaloacetate decarboxylase gamma subunit